MSAVLFSIIGSQNVQAQYLLYYPADAISLYGTPSIFVPAPVPVAGGTLPLNLYYPAIDSVPGTFVPPPTALSRVALTAINPVAASSIPLSVVPPVAPSNIYNLFYPAVGSVPGTFIAPPPPTGVGTVPFNLFYPAAGSVPGLSVFPPTFLP